nr:MAG TPA: cell division protein [Caudoviricetes sp.]
MSYSYKEKQKHFNDLRECQEHVQADIELLEKKSPAHPQLTSYKRAPERKLNEVLYELLDFATREEIVANRRSYKSPEQLATEEEAARLAAEEAEKKAAEEAARLAAEEAEKHESLQEEHETLKEEHEALQEENEDLQAENEELQEQTEALQEKLAEEKKKEPVKAGAKASGKKKSTPK